MRYLLDTSALLAHYRQEAGWKLDRATLIESVGLDPAQNEAEILSFYPDLEFEDIREALRYAVEVLQERKLPLVLA